MRTKSEDLMNKIAEFINEYYKQHGEKPTTRVVGSCLGINASTVSRYLKEMSEREMLSYDGGMVETSIISKMQGDYTSVPLIGSISCGTPLLEEENIEAYFRLPEKLFGRGEYFMLRANGNSMVNAGINDNDLVLIRRCEEANIGDIVVALTAENENTLKRFYPEPNKHRIRLKAENPAYKDIYTSECKIQGVAVKVLKDLK